MYFELGVAYESIRHLGTAFLAELPRLTAALIIIIVGYIAARGVRWGSERAVRTKRVHANLRVALGRLAFTLALALVLLLAATVAFPSFTIGSLIQLLGVSGVVIGFAFKDIFQNFLAGILLLITDPFEVGDQIIVDSFEGTVEQIQPRATLITTYDRRRVIVPNADLFTKSVTVNTAYERRRMMFDIPVKGTDDVEKVQRIIEQAVRSGIEGVEPDPVATALLVSIVGGALTFRVLWWSDSERGSYLIVQHRVLRAVHAALQAEQLTIG
ncbi:MAG: mechanosensitive ion channel family protein [Gemmatimonadaceae bacterium]